LRTQSVDSGNLNNDHQVWTRLFVERDCAACPISCSHRTFLRAPKHQATDRARHRSLSLSSNHFRRHRVLSVPSCPPNRVSRLDYFGPIARRAITLFDPSLENKSACLFLIRTRRRTAPSAWRKSTLRTATSSRAHAVTRHVSRALLVASGLQYLINCRFGFTCLTSRAQICRFCWHHIKENLNGLCPACRRQYSENQVEFKPMTSEEYV